MPSILNRISTDQLNIEQENDPYKSLPIKSIEQSYKPKSLIYSKNVEVESPTTKVNL